MAKSLVLLLLVVFLSAPAAFSQAFSSLSGTVADPTGAVVPGSSLTLINTQTGAQRQTKADSEGRYSFAQMLPGRYKLTATAPGLAEVIVNDIQLLVNSPATVNVTFEKVGSVTEVVSISADSVQVNTVDASLGNAIGTQAVLQLPFFARNVAGLLAFQPGVTAFTSSGLTTSSSDLTTDYRNGAVNGGKQDQANVTLDGVDVNDQSYRYPFTTVLRVPLDSVQEFRTTTLNANADQGRTSGAQTAIVTKRGTNEFHGSLYDYHRNTATAANSFFNNSAGVKRPALLIDVFGASVGGPIKQNRLFFFANYEGRRDRSATNILRTVPSAKLRDGIVQYQRSGGGIGELNPTDIQTRIDPARIGLNPASLALFKSYPLPNDLTVGDNLNTVGFRFTAPQKTKFDTYVTRLDYSLDSAGKHLLFLRGNLQNDRASGIPQFPGDPPRSVALANNKGIATGYTAVLKPNLISTFRYGLTRQGEEDTGIQNASATTFRGLDSRFALTTGLSRIIPVHNITQDFAWTKGAHDIRFGGVMRWIRNRRSNYANSFHSGLTNFGYLRGTGSDLQAGVPDLAPSFRNSFSNAVVASLGLVTQIDARYNYGIDGSVQAVGSPVNRVFAGEEYEMFVQDTWKISRGLTMTAGLRYSLMPPVYEANGVQISTNQSIGEWFNKRGALADQGKPQTEAGKITYILHNAQGGRPLYPYHKKNFAPRLSLAWSPQSENGFVKFLTGGAGKTSIRAGWGMFYDLFGQSLIRSYDATAFGLSTRLTNSSGQLTSLDAPRFSGFYSVPTTGRTSGAILLRPAPPGGFPKDQPDNFAITNSIDDTLRPPYNMNMNFTIGREFAGGIYIQGSYVGRLSRRSLISRDLAMPTNLTDPQSGMSYFQASQQIARLVRANTPVAQVPRIPFWENVWSTAAGGGLTATQNVYNEFAEWGPDHLSGTADLDQFDFPTCSRFGCNALFSSQFSSLAALSSVAGGNYHGMQWVVRKRLSEGLLFDFNYTWSKSTDLASTPERGGTTLGIFSGYLINPWFPGQLKGVSDYDATQIWNAFAVWELPFGRGRRWGSGMHPVLNAIAGGWQVAPGWRQSTELVGAVDNGGNWPTNWQLSGFATQVGPVPAAKNSKNAPAVTGTGGPNVFADPATALKGYDFTLPGESGQRNGLRGAGTFNIDLGVSKFFVMPYKESHRLQLRWETFNLTNSVRFDIDSASLSMGSAGTFGKYSDTLSSPRQMQFALRYEF